MSQPLPRSRAGAVAAALLFAFAGCSSDATSSADPGLRVDRVVLLTVDGLRADALDSMPALLALRTSALWTDEARSVLPAITLPAHLSILTGRDVTALGIRDNAFGEAEALTLLLSGTTPVFQWIDGPSDAVIGASLLSVDDLEQARTFFGLRRLTATWLDDDAIIDAAIAALGAADAPALLFVHLPEVDLTGHANGWIDPGTGSLGVEYAAAVRAADASIARLHAALAPAIAAGEAALVITSDHGGGHGVGCTVDVPPEREHCTAHEGDQWVPLMIVARDVDPRRLAGVTSIARVGPTVARLLGASIPGWAASPIVD
jgi:predicted AlkP superfamily pyrophosphatase or phosphodiesterase